jgi:hypothetical protein
LATFNAFASGDNGAGRNANVLAKGHDVVLAEWHSLNWQVLGLLLVMSRVDSMLKTSA